MVHGIEPLFPFDLAKATFLVPPPDTKPLSSSGLIAWRARQLQKRQEDLESIREHVLKAWFESVKHFEAAFKNRIKDFDFWAGSLVLVRNTRIRKELNQKMKPWYLGPMVVLCRTTGRSYLLAELDGVVSRLATLPFGLSPTILAFHLLFVSLSSQIQMTKTWINWQKKTWKSLTKKTETLMSQTSPGIRH